MRWWTFRAGDEANDLPHSGHMWASSGCTPRAPPGSIDALAWPMPPSVARSGHGGGIDAFSTSSHAGSLSARPVEGVPHRLGRVSGVPLEQNGDQASPLHWPINGEALPWLDPDGGVRELHEFARERRLERPHVGEDVGPPCLARLGLNDGAHMERRAACHGGEEPQARCHDAITRRG